MFKLFNGLIVPRHADESEYQLNATTREDILNFASKYYEVPGRHYHDLNHIKSMLRRHQVYFNCDATDKLFFAIVMHDAIWIAGQSPRSEEMSMALVPYVYYHTVGTKIPMTFNDKVFQLIRWTIASVHVHNNRPPSANSTLMNADVERILDLDLSSMSQDWIYFVETQRCIDLEFEHMANRKERAQGSAEFLKKFIDKGFVYYSQEMQHLNQIAMRNLKAYVCAIQGTLSWDDLISWDELKKSNPDNLALKYQEQ